MPLNPFLVKSVLLQGNRVQRKSDQSASQRGFVKQIKVEIIIWIEQMGGQIANNEAQWMEAGFCLNNA